MISLTRSVGFGIEIVDKEEIPWERAGMIRPFTSTRASVAQGLSMCILLIDSSLINLFNFYREKSS